jgi:hypothetical protein
VLAIRLLPWLKLQQKIHLDVSSVVGAQQSGLEDAASAKLGELLKKFQHQKNFPWSQVM